MNRDGVEVAQLQALAACCVLFLVHYALYSGWYIEDAAISFAFARNLAMGEGLVAFGGGERVEGYSNPSWTFLLAFFSLFRLDPFMTAKVLGALFGVLCLPLSWRWARAVVPGWSALLAPLCLAVVPQHVMWAASGLENSLFSFLLGLGMVRILDEREGGRPWSGLILFGLAITRPEAGLYAGLLWVFGVVSRTQEQSPAHAMRWALRVGVTFGVLMVVYHGCRIAYFAWPFPNTYYAKMGDEKLQLLAWDKAGWRYLTNWALVSAQGFLLPLYVASQIGLERGLRRLASASMAVMTLMVLVPGLWWPHELLERAGFETGYTEPEAWVFVRVAWLLGLAALLPLAGLGRQGQVPRGLAWFTVGTGLMFTLLSGGDWMKGFRWISLISVPLAVLTADLLAELRRLQRTGPVIGGLAIAGVLLTGGYASGFYLNAPETTPYSVKRRVDYIDGIKDKLWLDHTSLIEIDMGAHVWWSSHRLYDMAGLLDVPVGHHIWEPPFIEEYVHKEIVPDFAHSHGGWQSRTGVHRFKQWRNYVPLPDYPVSVYYTHPGNYIRRDHLVVKRWDGPADATLFGDALTLVGMDIVTEQVHGFLAVRLGWRRGLRTVVPFRIWLVVSTTAGQPVMVRELAPGYDWVPPTSWKRREMVADRHLIPMPELSPGTYDLSLVVVGEEGVIASTKRGQSFTEEEPAYAQGEIRWPAAFTVVSEEEVIDVARALAQEATSHALEGRCAKGEAAWRKARLHLGWRSAWNETQTVPTDLARCFAYAAEKQSDIERAGAEIARARDWNRWDPEVRHVAGTLASAWVARGEHLEAQGALDAAYQAWRSALRAEPHRAWLRRKTEALRDRRLGLEEAE